MKIKPFKRKKKKVQDYPDSAFTITLYGDSDISKYKLGDQVIVVNSDRVGYCNDAVIGFDSDGDAMLKYCSWCNTRGGYTDNMLVHTKDFIEYLENIPQLIQDEIEIIVQNQKEFEKKLKGEYNFNYKKTLKHCTNTYISRNWKKINK